VIYKPHKADDISVFCELLPKLAKNEHVCSSNLSWSNLAF